MDISIISLKSNSWMKMVRWGCVFLVLTCSCAFLLHAPERFLSYIALGEIDAKTRWWIGILLVVCSFASICCAIPFIISVVKCWTESRQWRGKRAMDKIKRLSIQAQEEVREHVNGESFQLYNEGEVYMELLGGYFIEVIPPKHKLMVNCRLKKWVLECFKRYPNLVNELHEMDAAMREADQNFP